MSQTLNQAEANELSALTNCFVLTSANLNLTHMNMAEFEGLNANGQTHNTRDGTRNVITSNTNIDKNLTKWNLIYNDSFKPNMVKFEQVYSQLQTKKRSPKKDKLATMMAGVFTFKLLTTADKKEIHFKDLQTTEGRNLYRNICTNVFRNWIINFWNKVMPHTKIILAELHLDETNPHFHIQFANYNEAENGFVKARNHNKVWLIDLKNKEQAFWQNTREIITKGNKTIPVVYQNSIDIKMAFTKEERETLKKMNIFNKETRKNVEEYKKRIDTAKQFIYANRLMQKIKSKRYDYGNLDGLYELLDDLDNIEDDYKNELLQLKTLRDKINNKIDEIENQDNTIIQQMKGEGLTAYYVDHDGYEVDDLPAIEMPDVADGTRLLSPEEIKSYKGQTTTKKRRGPGMGY